MVSFRSKQPAKRGRRWLKIVGVVVVLLFALIALLPTLISMGLGNGIVRNAIAANINGDVHIDHIGVGWFSGQRVEGVRIVDAAGKEAANVSVSLDNSLLSLALGRAKPMRITISGNIAGEIRSDGSLSLADLIKSDPNAPSPPKQPNTGSTGHRRSPIPLLHVTIDGLTVALDDHRTGQSMKIADLKGTVAHVDEAQPITIDVHGTSATTVAGRTESGSIDIAGKADGLFAGDGSLTLRGASADFNVKASGVPLPIDALTGGKPATLARLNLALASDDLTERIALNMDGSADVQGASAPTTFKVDGSVSRLIDGRGALSLRAASLNLAAEAANVPVESPGVSGVMNRLSATIVSDDLTKAIQVAAQGDGKINGNQESELSANLALAHPFEPDGTFTFEIENLTGSASGTRVPTSLAEPALLALGIDPLRDLGPTMDLEASFPGGVGGDLMVVAKAPKATAELTAKVNADQSITGSKLVLHLPAADPALIDALTNGSVFSDRPLGVQVDLTSFALPAPDATTLVRPLGQFAVTGTMAIVSSDGLANIGVGTAAPADRDAPVAATPRIPLERFDLTLSTPALADRLHVTGDMTVGADISDGRNVGRSVRFEQEITHLVDEAGALTLAQAQPSGTVTVDAVAAEAILAFLPEAQRPIASELLGGWFSADIHNTVHESQLAAVIGVRGHGVNVNSRVIRERDGTLAVTVSTIDATITPQLASLVQSEEKQTIEISQPLLARVEIDELGIPAGVFADVLDAPIRGRITISDAMISKAPGIAQPLAIPSLQSDLTLVKKDAVLTATVADGSATINCGAAKNSVARMRVSGSVEIDSTGGTAAVRPNLDVRLTEINTRQAEALLGMESGTIADWTGDSGSLDVHVESVEDGYLARATPGMPHIQGTFAVSVRDELVSVTAETSRLILGKEALQARLNPSPTPTSDESESTAATPSAEFAVVAVERDVPMQVAIRTLEFPLAMIRSKMFDPAEVNIDLALTGGPLLTTSSNGVKSTLADLDLTFRAANLSNGLQFALKGVADSVIPEGYIPAERSETAHASTAPAEEKDDASMAGMTPEQRREARREARARERAATRPADEPASQPAFAPLEPASQPQPGRLDITGVLTNLISSEGRLDVAGGTLHMNALVESVPTAVADALGDMRGMLVAAVGPQMNATFIADSFSRNSGTLDAKITTTNGSLSGILRGREQSFRVNRNAPVVAELKLTTQLRDRLLVNIHPILADIRTTEQPLRVTIPTALAAMPADVSKLRAEIEITVGKVELDSGSTTLKLLSLFGRGDRVTIPGEIEPIAAKIHNGIVTYQKFAVHIDRYTLNYSGQIDLVKQEVDLRTEIPLKALGDRIEQLQGFADAISVPLVTRGKFGSLKTSIDPDFDIGKAALDAGFKGTLGNLLGGENGGGTSGAGGLLDRLFNKDKEAEPTSQPERPRERPRRRETPTSQPGGNE